MELYGSLTNRMMEASKQPTPTEGMGATVIMYTDRHAATIVHVVFGGLGCGPTEVTIQEDKAIRTDANGMSDSQSYRYEPNTTAPRRFFTRRKNGFWVEKGQRTKDGVKLMVGERDSYHDYDF